MKKAGILLLGLMLVGTMLWAGGSQEGKTEEQAASAAKPVNIALWTKEGEADGGLQFVQKLAEAYMAQNQNVTIEVLNKNVEELREDFQTASLAGDPPDLLWTVNDHAGPFVVADLIQPVGDLVDLSKYVESVEMNGQTWAVPISSGNHLMLIYNRNLLPEPPETSDELLGIKSVVAAGADYPLVWNQTEPFWLVPWLGGFGGKVFEEDGVTPNLDTQAMVDTLDFLLTLKEEGIVPPESDYDGADAMFKEGKAAMIINGDWSLGSYTEIFGEDFGVARIPKVSKTGQWPAPYTSGTYFMIPRDVSDAKRDVIVDFINFATSEENQIDMVNTLTRLPALKSALNSDVVTSNPILESSAEQMAVGTPMPSVLEMRAVWDAIKPEQNAVLAGQKTPEEAAEAMQETAEAGIRNLQ